MAAAHAEEPVAPPRDHQAHHWAVGAFAAGSVALPGISLFTAYPPGTLNAPLPYANAFPSVVGAIPAVGGRIWLLRGASLDLGLDVALGISTAAEGRRSSPDPSAVGDPNAQTQGKDFTPSAVYVHVGMPMAVYQGRHYTMEFIPEINVGYGWARGSYSGQEAGASSAVQTDGHGIGIDVGLRAGPEISFGFFDLPELVIQPTVGFLVHWDSTFAGSRAGSARGEVLESHVNVNSAVSYAFARFDAALSLFYYF